MGRPYSFVYNNLVEHPAQRMIAMNATAKHGTVEWDRIFVYRNLFSQRTFGFFERPGCIIARSFVCGAVNLSERYLGKYRYLSWRIGNRRTNSSAGGRVSSRSRAFIGARAAR